MSFHGCKRLAAIVALLGVAAVANFGQQADVAQVRLTDLAGRQTQPLRNAKAKAVVFFFVQTSCPVSNRYAPEIKRLYQKFASAGVKFWLVYPDVDDSAAAIRRHGKDYGYKLGALRDTKHALVKATGASVTPEAAVFAPSPDGPRMIYRGRIDDRVAAFGKTRPAPTARDVEQILAAILGGKPFATTTTVAVGCAIAAVK